MANNTERGGRSRGVGGELQPRRRSERVATLTAKQQRGDGGNTAAKLQSQSAQKPQRGRGRGKSAAGRRSAPTALPEGAIKLLVVPEEIVKVQKPEANWQSLQPEILETFVTKLRAPCQIATMRQVCKAWCRAVQYGLQRIQSDNAWEPIQLATAVARFPNIMSLDLQNCQMLTAKSLAPLPKLRKLRHLRLHGGSSLTYPDIVYLEWLTDLVTLSLPSCDKMLALHAIDFTSLQRLDLTGCHWMSDLVLRNLPSLACISLRECRNMENRVFNSLSSLTALTAIDLSYCLKADDYTMGYLQKLPQLSLLCLNCCRNITDDGLLTLQPAPRLASLYLDGCTAITEEGMVAMKKQAPHVKLIRMF